MHRCCRREKLRQPRKKTHVMSQADKVSANAYGGPSAASKYTYDNGDAPFSRSWNGMGVDQPPSQPASPAQQIRDPGTSSREAPGRPIPTNFRPTRAPMTSSKATGERDAAILAATATTPDPSGSTMPKSGVASPPSPPGSVGAPTVARGTGEHTARPPNNGHNKAVMVDITGAPLAAEQVATGPHTTGEDGTGGMDATSTGGGDVSGGGMREEARGRQDSTRGIALAVRALTKEVSELRDQLASARKEEAITRSALRKLQEEVAVLRERGVSRA